MSRIIGCWKVFDGTEDVGSTNAVIKGLSTLAMIPIMAGHTFSLFADASSTGTIALKVECFTHFSDTIASAVEPEGMADILTIADGSLHHDSFNPPVTQWMAIKVTGTGANDAATRVVIHLLIQESVG